MLQREFEGARENQQLFAQQQEWYLKGGKTKKKGLNRCPCQRKKEAGARGWEKERASFLQKRRKGGKKEAIRPSCQ